MHWSVRSNGLSSGYEFQRQIGPGSFLRPRTHPEESEAPMHKLWQTFKGAIHGWDAEADYFHQVFKVKYYIYLYFNSSLALL